MDILDIDEILKDDSYIFLADKTHDDISNILQQWKTNNQSQTLPSAQQLHYNNEQAYKLNSKTFTRPKRRTMAAQNVEPQLHTQIYQAPPMFNLEIGGLVTNMQKSFLQDTSPPSSISSSTNNERMNNSLITSADFTNLNFLQSTQSLEFNMQSPDCKLSTMATESGYTLGDMIRDRKALESLTMSGDGTLIKDSHIGQIDDISLTLSKTASGYSTMDNSTDSMSTANECNNRTVATAADRTMPAYTALQRTIVLSEEMIGDTTFNLVDSMTTPTTEALPAQLDNNATFKKPAPHLDQTQLLTARQVNTTYTEESDITEARCETPENVDKQLAALQIESSTPLTTGTRNHYLNNNNNINRKQFTPTLKNRNGDEINLSPIVGTTPHKVSRLLNNTYEPAKNETSAASFDGNKFVMETMELLEQIEQPLDGTYNMSVCTEQEKDAMLAQHKQMQCVMDLAEAEVELLAQQGDEEQFEHMLAELGKVNALNAEQLKMQKSLESIKRRFTSNGEAEEQMAVNVTQDLKPESQTVKETSCTSMLASSQCQSNSSGERLLSRRSRLYDDVNLNAMQAGGNVSTSSCNSTSFIVQRREDEQLQNTDNSCSPLDEDVAISIETEATQASSYKLNERRERDRERFKTIRITKEMRDEKEQEIVVPCIDDDYDQVVAHQQPPQQRLSRRELAETAASNYLTYKKPKEKSQLSRRQLPEPSTDTLPATRIEPPRSLSRPRYISGLQKFTTVSKATSAGTGLNATHVSAGTRTDTTAVSGKTASSAELKSPMGIKSKSFHNLSSNINGSGANMPRASLGGLRLPSGQPMPSKLMNGLRAPAMQQQEADESSVFKVPKLVNGSRAAANSLAKRSVVGNGLARPSSGYYSLSVAAKASATEVGTPESLSSASSRGSLYGKEGKQTEGTAYQALDSQSLSAKLTQATTGATGMPKPSGLRQPTQMKRSGLPRPSSVVRR